MDINEDLLQYLISGLARLLCFSAEIFRRLCKFDFGPYQGSSEL